MNITWGTYQFSGQADHATLPILANKLLPKVKIPWGPDAHAHSVLAWIYSESSLAIKPGSQGGSTTHFLCGLNTSLFAFLKLNLQWDSTLRLQTETIQQRLFMLGHLTITSKSDLQFPTLYKPKGTCIGVDIKWIARVTDSGDDPTGQRRMIICHHQQMKCPRYPLHLRLPSMPKGKIQSWPTHILCTAIGDNVTHCWQSES